MMALQDFVRRALTVPFIAGGRDWSGWDCWGLVRLAQRELFAVELPSYADRYDPALSFAEAAGLVAEERPSWREIAEPVFGDIGLFRVGRHATHVALVLPQARMIHAESASGTLVEPIGTIAWRDRHVGWYRHAD